MNKVGRIILAILLAMVLTGASFIGAVLFLNQRYGRLLAGDDASVVQSKTAEVQTLIAQYYIDEYDEAALAEGAASGMGQTLDEWSYYLAADEVQAYTENMSNAYVGIGITISVDEEAGGMRVQSVSAGGPAEEAGIRVDDILLEVEGQQTLTLGMDGTRELVRGQEGTEVALTLSREGEVYSVRVERRSIATEVTTGELLQEGIGYLKITNFNEHCAQETVAEIERLQAEGAQALLFDVRFNPGGYADELVELLDYLLPEGEVFRTVDYAGHEEVDRSDANCLELPMAVLVNEESYSAAEFFAAALQDYDWAEIVGSQTYGKGKYQVAFSLSDGSMLNLSIGKYYTPNGKNLSGVGVTPDVTVELDDTQYMQLYYGTLEQEDDPQLQAAIGVLREKMEQ